jgi:hypothetical protein
MDSTPMLDIRVHLKNLTRRDEMPDGLLDDVRIYMYLRFPACQLLLGKGRQTGVAAKSNARTTQDIQRALWNRSRPQNVQTAPPAQGTGGAGSPTTFP